MAFQRALTIEQEKELVVDYEDGWTVNECSVIYRVSIRTVYRILSDHGARLYRPKTSRKRKPRPKKPRELKPCGTNAAYQRHNRAGEYPCTACLEAHSENVKAYKNKEK